MAYGRERPWAQCCLIHCLELAPKCLSDTSLWQINVRHRAGVGIQDEEKLHQQNCQESVTNSDQLMPAVCWCGFLPFHKPAGEKMNESRSWWTGSWESALCVAVERKKHVQWGGNLDGGEPSACGTEREAPPCTAASSDFWRETPESSAPCRF